MTARDCKALTSLKRKREERTAELWGKESHGQFSRLSESIASGANWTCTQKEQLNEETEGLLVAAQIQPLRTSAVM